LFNDSFLVYDDNDKAFATPEQLAQLDELHYHIKAENKMSTFIKVSKKLLAKLL